MIKQEGGVVMIERKHVDFVVLYDRDGPMERQLRTYFMYPTRNMTMIEARKAADADYARRLK